MCGIFCIVSQDSRIDKKTVEKLRDEMILRGPDAGGIYISKNERVALAHRRLSILDLSSASNQPMSIKNFHLSYNGEIYNYIELRNKLKQLGYEFKTNSDTEVVLIAWIEWGIESINYLEGMFSFIIYDENNNKLFLIRDRFGIKPLYYYHSEHYFIASSTINPIYKHPSIKTDIDFLAIDEYLTYCYIPPPRTIWKNIKKLSPAHYIKMEVNTNSITEMKYWDLKISNHSSKSLEDNLRSKINESVKGYMVSDVPVGVFLSGGWDSSIITSQATKHYRNKLKAFTIGFDVEKHSELELAKVAANFHNVEHYFQVVTNKNGYDIIDDIIDIFEEPYAISSAIPMLYLARFAKEHVTVALSGDGGDEVFCGYKWYINWQKLQEESFWKTTTGKILEKCLHKLRGRRKKKWWLYSLEPLVQYSQLMGSIHKLDKMILLGNDLLYASENHDALHYFRKHYRSDLTPFSRLQYLDIKTFLPEVCLTKVDRTTMACSLEARVPFLNHTLVEWLFQYSENARVPNQKLKGLLKKTFIQNVPKEVSNSKKKGFQLHQVGFQMAI